MKKAKKILAWLVALCTCALFSACTDIESSNNSDNVQTSNITSVSIEEVTTTSEFESNNLTFELIAGEEGEYGKPFTYNEGTEFPKEVIEYFVPCGIYKITNIGDYMTQVNVYSDEIHITEEGWQ